MSIEKVDKVEKFETIKVEKVKKKGKIAQDFSMKICKVANNERIIGNGQFNVRKKIFFTFFQKNLSKCIKEFHVSRYYFAEISKKNQQKLKFLSETIYTVLQNTAGFLRFYKWILVFSK